MLESNCAFSKRRYAFSYRRVPQNTSDIFPTVVDHHRPKPSSPHLLSCHYSFLSLDIPDWDPTPIGTANRRVLQWQTIWRRSLRSSFFAHSLFHIWKAVARPPRLQHPQLLPCHCSFLSSDLRDRDLAPIGRSSFLSSDLYDQDPALIGTAQRRLFKSQTI